MPLYEYHCEACGSRFEKIRKYADPPLEECPKCGKGPVTKLPSSPAIQFKGSGFYITDYAKKSSPDSSSTPSSSDTKTDAKKSDTAASTTPSTPAGGDKKD